MNTENFEMAGSSPEEEKGTQPPEKKQIKLLPEEQERFGLLVNQFKEADDIGDAANVLDEINKFLEGAVARVEAEEQRRNELVTYDEKEMRRFEAEALQDILKEINEDYEEQGYHKSMWFSSLPGVEVADGRVRGLYFKEMDLTRIPPSIVKLIDVIDIDLKQNEIVEVIDLSSLKQLKSISLNFTNIKSLRGIGHVPSLKHVIISDSKLEDLDGTETLSSLDDLNIFNSPIGIRAAGKGFLHTPHKQWQIQKWKKEAREQVKPLTDRGVRVYY
jgi:hypothetical protein